MKERECDFLLCAFCHVMPLADSRIRCCHVYEQEKDNIPLPSSQPQLLLPFLLIEIFLTTYFFWGFYFFFNWTFIEVKVAINMNKRPNILFQPKCLVLLSIKLLYNLFIYPIIYFNYGLFSSSFTLLRLR